MISILKMHEDKKMEKNNVKHERKVKIWFKESHKCVDTQ